MTGFLLVLVGIIYIGVAGNYLYEGNVGMSIAFFAYSLANYGLYLAGK